MTPLTSNTDKMPSSMSEAQPAAPASRDVFLTRRMQLVPTWRGWLLILTAVVGAATFGLHSIHPFLAIARPVEADILVIEGWIPEYALPLCADMVRRGTYQHVVTVGGPVTGMPSPANDDDTHAYVAMKALRRAGLPADLITMVPTPDRDRDRTFHCASTLQQWLRARGITPRGVNVVTVGPHARRSRLMFQKALGAGTPVGVVPITNQEYDPDHWWRYSEGIREVISESAAYLYARFFFFS